MTHPTLDQRLQQIVAAVGEARRALADGAAVDLTGLDAAVAELCETATAADPAAKAGIVAAIASLQAALDALAADLTRQNSALHLKRAAAAYGGDPGP
jgi:hypothetical protein